MILSKLHIIALKSIKGIGTQKLLIIGNKIKDCSIKIASNKDLLKVLVDLNIKVDKATITIDVLEEAIKRAQQVIDIHKKYGIGIVTYYEDEYPSILRNTVNEEGKLDPPMILYYKGDLAITQMPGLAIIGTREVTDFGRQAGLYLAQEFSKKGFCIVSGLAVGCDTIGHKGALNVGGKTIAFLAHGLDTVYPSENKGLAQEIVEKGGLLFSEYPIGMGVNRYNLVARDRLQAGMSLATLVIQTGVNGGTMHAANATLEARKLLYVVRFKEDAQNKHEKSLGNAELFKKGAKYISGSDNISEISEHIKKSSGSNNCQMTLFG